MLCFVIPVSIHVFVALSCRRPAGRPVLLVFVEKMTSGAGHVTTVAGTCQTQLENIKENKFLDFGFKTFY
jgi:hypothetical protein